MPLEIMDQRGLSPSSFFYEEIRFPAERHVGFWKSESMPDQHGVGIPGESRTSDIISVATLSQEKLVPVGARPIECLELPQTYLVRDQKVKLSLERPVIRAEKAAKIDVNGAQYENGLFSSSLSEIFTKKLRLSVNDVLVRHSVDSVASHYEEEEPFESLKEIEAQTIGNLLPDDDDLLSGVIDKIEYIAQPNSENDIEDFDLFSSGGGMELEGDDGSSAAQRNSDFSGGISNCQPAGSNSSIAGEHPYGEHPSRTLFVRNISSNVEDSELKALFGQYGDIRTLYTSCKQRGFVMISYYDIRAARNAMRALQNKPLRLRKLDIHFSIPKDNPSEKDINQGTLVVFNLDSSVSNDDLCQIFGAYGEIKEIRETPHKHHHKFIEFYDVRAAEAALRALNRSDIAGKCIKLEPSRPGGARQCLMQQFSPELEQEESIECQQQGSRPNISPSGCFLFGSSGNGSCPLRGFHNMWSNSSSYHPHPPAPVMWPNSSSFVNDVNVHSSAQLHGVARSPSNMMNTNLPIYYHHHVGSAPAVNHSLWERRHTYAGESPDGSSFHSGSLGSMVFSGSSNLHPLELASHNVFHVGGNCMDPSFPSTSVGMHSPQQQCHMFPIRNPMVPMPSSFDAPNGRIRSRRSEGGSSQIDNKKQYELDIDRIVCGEDTRTTLMIKNIPNKYTSKMLLAAIDEHQRGTYDFIYLPIDFKNKCNVGYAFINMIDSLHIIPFYQAFNGKKWEKFNSEKVASLAYARIQGKAALIAHFQNSSLMNEDKRCRPILFHSDGPNAGDQEPFPLGINIRSRPSKSRTSGNEENHEESPSTSVNGEESSNGIDASSGSAKDLE
ncbi:protein MEI2-like 4 isoform X5 [Telopea speciosissima]|uniref:protein MEI2-like 4 isoform X5 n=1 Tax=Telopea speciosissima TaxID=54955 RepID=UPI001CC4644B|nr:protein MEI2-like 4 isoform X5 [Telopea speciosissima]